ncbi:TPA: hypothetical protein RI762_003422 [Vibrio cholerae]|nr:hypothetical protein [Vibrio cholerae]HDV5438748.1 hypothetical protein [Vibrio cholerae]HDV5461145.1 hypothetical protein [Vibrio cholerae]HDV5468463.1 hypothetical protein [Vibrio cholerae]HDV5472051.1 hypothetical protein [Vibrio cholerae]
MHNIEELNDRDLIIINNILVKEIMSLKSQLNQTIDEDSLEIGKTSLKGLIEMYSEHQAEIDKRSLRNA